MSVSEPIRFGVVGCGVIGKIHVAHAQPLSHCQVTAVCDVREEIARSVAEEFNVPFATTNASELIQRPDVDAVVLALPTAYRFELAQEVLENGKHLLLEKPAAMNLGQLEILKQKQGDQLVASCSCRLSKAKSVTVARDAIQAGKIGAIRTIHCRCLAPAGEPPKDPPPPWRLKRDVNGGGIFVNWGCYDLDFLFSHIDWELSPLTSVTAKSFVMPPDFGAHQAEGSDAEAHMAVVAQFENGLLLQYERAERATARKEDSWQIIGDKGALHLNMLDPSAPVLIDTTDPEKGVISEVLHHEEEPDYKQHAIPMDDFASAILEGRAPQTSLERLIQLQILVDATYQSADSGKPVIL
jgi:predicted dehydrogenase